MMKPSEVYRLPLTSDEKLVLLALLDYGGKAFPRQGTLAEKTSMSVRAVQRCVHRLRQAGYLVTASRGKALTYRVCYASVADHDTSGSRIRCVRVAEEIRQPDVGILTSPINESKQPAPATPEAGGGDHPFDGVEPEAERRIRRWAPGDTEHLATCQRRVVTRVLGELGVKPGDWRRWWGSLCDRWGDSGVPPYQVLKAELDGIGPDVRDRVAVLAFRLKIGRVAA